MSTKPIRSLAAGLALLTALAGCSSGQETTTTTAAGGPATSGGGAATTKAGGKVTIAYLQKQGDQQYFVDQAEGAKKAAKDLGPDVEVQVVNLGSDANKAISEVDAAAARKVSGIIIVVPDQQIGPQVVDKAKAANIPLMASDDSIKDGNGKEAPFAGFDGKQMGQSVGKEAAKLYKAGGWTAADTRIIAAYKQDLTVCKDRTEGAKEAFTTDAGGEIPKIIDLGTDNTSTGAQDKAGAIITANQGVKNWVVWGCNDENTTGVTTALQNAGKKPANIISVGLGAYLACKDWNANQDTGNKAALYIDGAEVGAAAVKAMYAKVKNGAELPPKTVAKTTMVGKSNWQQTSLKCT